MRTLNKNEWEPYSKRDLEKLEKRKFISGWDDNRNFFIWKEKYEDVKRMEARRWEALSIRKRIGENYWQKFFEEGHKYGEVWGYVPTYKDPNKKEKVIYAFTDNGVSHEAPRELRDEIAIALDEELPLLINEKMDENTRIFYKARLSGKIPSVPYRQDIINLSLTYEHRIRKINFMINVVNNMLKDYVYIKYRTKLAESLRYKRNLIKLIINEREYLFIYYNHRYDFLHAPEDSIITEYVE